MPTVYIKETEGKYQLIRNGKPFYIYGGAAQAVYLEELSDAGGNTARIYDTTNLKKKLDVAEELGLAVVVDIPMPKHSTDRQFYEDPDLFEELQLKVEEVVTRHKDHPALLYWNLGNELYYPYFFQRTEFFEKYNSLLDLIHEIDPNHPVSTTTIGANKLRVLSIELMSPQLDFISFNSFGILSQFAEKLEPITPFWDGPHVITEWGVNGPWEAEITAWGAPIEETSSKKAEQIYQRYYDYIEPLQNDNSLGSFVFYWGEKNEVTPTWYSLFENDLKSEATFRLKQIWSGSDSSYPGPSLEYMLINEEGAGKSIILTPGEKAKAALHFEEVPPKNYTYSWELREESWYASHISKVLAPGNIKGEGSSILFYAPVIPGPYRLHVTITNDTGYFASANTPFYVLSPEDEE